MSHPDLTGKRVRFTRDICIPDAGVHARRGETGRVDGGGFGRFAWVVFNDSDPAALFAVLPDEIEVIE